jgi:hypothetical protein
MTPTPLPPDYGTIVQECPLRKKEKTWIAIQLVGEDDKPIPGIPYRILLTDGTTKEGILDREGSARVDDIDPGTCVVTFPELDQDAWEGI